MRNGLAAVAICSAVAVVVALRACRRDVVAVASRAVLESPALVQDEEAALEEIAAGIRSSFEDEDREPSHIPLPEDHGTPSNEQELAELVGWMRSLDHDELLRLSNAEFGFEKSELVQILQELHGDWVVPALGGLAVAEGDPLVKAILVEGLVGALSPERADDERVLPILDALMGQMAGAAEDPHEVASGLAIFAYTVCLRGDRDYVSLMSGHLAQSDNPGFLTQGFLWMGQVLGAEEVLKQTLASHASSAGRLGALEGMRAAALKGRIAPGEVTALGLAALDLEQDEGNRLLLYEMVISTGGEEGLTAVEQILRNGNVEDIGHTVGLLALKMAPARANVLFQDILRDHELDGPAKQAMYNAMALVEGEQGVDFLLGLVRSEDLEPHERLAGLKGLWNRALDERLDAELRDLFDRSDDPALRTEAMRMLAYGETGGDGLDMRAIAALDDDPSVRAEAVQLAAMQPSGDTREWLEDRLMQDESMDVKAAALGALVFQAHYTGDGDAVLGYLGQARRLTDDESVRAMIDEGERMVKDYDARNLELGLAEEAEFWGTVARYTDGPASRSFQRQADQLGRIVSSLRMAMDERRPPR